MNTSKKWIASLILLAMGCSPIGLHAYEGCSPVGLHGCEGYGYKYGRFSPTLSPLLSAAAIAAIGGVAVILSNSSHHSHSHS